MTITAVRGGVDFGECLGYCAESVSVTASATRYRARARLADPSFPPIDVREPTDQDEWTALTTLVSWRVLSELPETTGAPDSADAGAEWLEVEGERGKRRFLFDASAEPVAIRPIIDRLRRMRERLANQHRPSDA